MSDPSPESGQRAPHHNALHDHPGPSAARTRVVGLPEELACDGSTSEASLPEVRLGLVRIIRGGDIFAGVARVRLSDGDPAIHCHTCLQGPAVRNLGQQLSKYMYCGGAGFTEGASWTAAAGEGIERYCATWFSMNADFFYGAWEQLPDDAPQPETWSLYSEAQYGSPEFPCRPLTSRTETKWYAGFDLSSGASCLLPGPMVCFPYWRKKGEERITPATTTGLAFGFGHEEAYRSALWEVIERDALALAWNWRLPVRKIDSGTGLPYDLMRRAGLDERYMLDAYDITSDLGIPTCMSFIRVQDASRRLLSIGAACRGSLREALEKAVLEALQGVPYVRFLCQQKFADWTFGGSFSEVRSFEHGAAFYSMFPEMLDRYLSESGDFLNATEVVSVPDTVGSEPLDLAGTVAALRRLRYRAYAVDMSTELLRNEGCVVARVIVPGLYALEGAYRFRPRSQTRARAAAHKLGADISANPFPHPLP